MNRAFNLYRLQQVDSQLDAAKSRLAEIDEILGEDETLRKAKEAVVSAEEAQSATAKTLRRAEEEVAVQQGKIEHNQKALYGGAVTNPKELEDLQLESEALKRHLEALETTQLEKMLADDEARNALTGAQKALHETQTDRAKEHGELGEEQKRLLDEVGRLNEEREAVEPGISEDDLGRYAKLREKKAGLAVAKVRDKTCTACGTKLSEALAQAARSPSELSTCSTCKRILYSG